MTPVFPFEIGNQYSRKEVFDLVGINDAGGGKWYTGYTSHKTDWFIFCGIGTSGRTGHDYQNYFNESELVWYGRNGSKLSHSSIQSLISGTGHVYIFFREDNRGPFTFAGNALPKSAEDTSPVKITWEFHDFGIPLAEEIIRTDKIYEGAKKSVIVNSYERNPLARKLCIAHWGCKCLVCGLDFASRYGDLGQGFIHVHHLVPLSEIGEEYKIDPVKDMRPVCPNCHAMLHKKSPPLFIEELKTIICSL